MIAFNLQGVDFVVANTDAQQLMHSRADRRIQLGPHLTQGLGAGAKPEIGRAAAEEAADELMRHLEGTHMVFITAGMGGGTGTGAAPVIARMARERGVLTVGVVTKPFTFEGARRTKAAEAGIAELQQYVDTLIVIPNQNLFRLANERTGWKEAFKMADNVLYMGVRGVTDLMMAPGLVNLDFADIRTVMAEMGKAMMGTGEAEGENRAIRAAEAAISNPLLEDTSMAGARGLLINITGGEDMTLFEVDQAANRIREEVADDANIIFGSAGRREPGRQGARVGGGDRHRHRRSAPRRSGRRWSRSAMAAWSRRSRTASCRTAVHAGRAAAARRPRRAPAPIAESAPADAACRCRRPGRRAAQPAPSPAPSAAPRSRRQRRPAPAPAAQRRRAPPRRCRRRLPRRRQPPPQPRRLSARKPVRHHDPAMRAPPQPEPTEPQRAEPSFSAPTRAPPSRSRSKRRRDAGHPGIPAPPDARINDTLKSMRYSRNIQKQ